MRMCCLKNVFKNNHMYVRIALFICDITAPINSLFINSWWYSVRYTSIHYLRKYTWTYTLFGGVKGFAGWVHLYLGCKTDDMVKCTFSVSFIVHLLYYNVNPKRVYCTRKYIYDSTRYEYIIMKQNLWYYVILLCFNHNIHVTELKHISVECY